ncbi:MAG: DsbA family protein [Pseudomonadota bacterium]
MMTIDARLALFSLSLFAVTACGQSATETAEPAETTQEAEAAAPTETAEAEAQPELLPAPEGSRAAEQMVIGSADASLTIVEYASVTCGGCANFHANLFPAIKEQFIDTGLVRFEYREFPTPPVRLSQAGFIVARCAATASGPEGYYAVVDALYKTQRNWIYSQEPGTELRNLAAQVGIGGSDFDDCFAREDIRDVLVSSIESGRDLGVDSTPTLVIDGKIFDYGRTEEEMIERIAAEVEKRS